MKIISETTKTTEYKTRMLSVDKFLVTESYIDGVLNSQKWSVEGGFIKTHPDAYNPEGFSFAYYEDISFLNSNKCSNTHKFYEIIPNPKLITDWDILNLDHILCIYLGMDGNIYRINDPKPVDLWRHQQYIGSFNNRTFKLTPLAAELMSTKNIRNVKIVDIPHYNQDDGKTQAIEFDYFGQSFETWCFDEFEKQFFNLSNFRKKVKIGYDNY